MNLHDVLYVFTLTGPLFSISQVIGVDRTRYIEELILNSFKKICKVAIATFSIATLCCILLGLEFLYFNPNFSKLYGDYGLLLGLGNFYITLFAQYKLKWFRMLRGSYISFSIWLISITLIFKLSNNLDSITQYITGNLYYPLFFFVLTLLYFISLFSWLILTGITIYYLISLLAYKFNKKICNYWRNYLNTVPPWPISLAEKPYNFLLAIFSAFTIISGVLAIVLLFVIFPCIIAEYLRHKFTPEKPIYMDLLGYMVSVASFIFLFYDKITT